MKLISWNIRGLNSPGKGQLMNNMLQQEKPQILILEETKCNSTTLDQILAKAWPGSKEVVVEAMGASGGLAIVWDDRDITLTNIHASKNFIQAKFHLTRTNVDGHLTNVYFPQEVTKKVDTLNTLTHINSERSHALWITGGDFNMITRLEEKRGGRIKLDCESMHFKNYIHNNGLIDIEFNNGVYTWNNKHASVRQIPDL